MSSVTLVSADELLTLPHGMGKRYELVKGELRVMPPFGWRHGQVIHNVQGLLGAFILDRGLGRGFGGRTGFFLARNPDTVRAPDFAFISNKNVPQEDPSEAFWPGAPDLAVEVLSPGDTTKEVNEKVQAWLSAGSQSVWIVDPIGETVAIHRSRTDIQIRTAGETLEGGSVVPGFSCPVDELFR